MIVFQFLVALLSINFEDLTDWSSYCKQQDTAQLNLVNKYDNQTLVVFYQIDECKSCDLIALRTLSNNESTVVNIDSYYSYQFRVESNVGSLVCSRFEFNQFVECGQYELNIQDESQCSIRVVKQPNSSYYLYPIYIAGFIFVLFVCAASFLDTRLTGDQVTTSSNARLESLDTFRGFSLFVMIFVNYGSGGYKSLQHAIWHGINLADYVFPWFLWIMGFTIPIITHSLLIKASKASSIKKVSIRAVKMFCIGLMLNSRFGVALDELRYMGVLQRIAICYLVASISEILLYKRVTVVSSSFLTHLVWSKFHIAFMVALFSIWYWAAFLMNVPNCQRGYFGPGGLHDHSAHSVCTGGATGYIDKLILGHKHLYNRPTAKKIYQTTENFDPEGLLGTLSSIILTCLGALAGRAMLFLKNQPSIRLIIYWLVWSLISFLLSFILSSGLDFENGWIPVNKNLGTPTYALLTASSSFIIMSIFFYLIDLKRLWSGSPFKYLGKNSLLIYIAHVLFARMLPVYFVVSNSHLSQILMNLWGSIFWTLFSTFLFAKRLFFNL